MKDEGGSSGLRMKDDMVVLLDGGVDRESA